MEEGPWNWISCSFESLASSDVRLFWGKKASGLKEGFWEGSSGKDLIATIEGSTKLTEGDGFDWESLVRELSSWEGFGELLESVVAEVVGDLVFELSPKGSETGSKLISFSSSLEYFLNILDFAKLDCEFGFAVK